MRLCLGFPNPRLPPRPPRFRAPEPLLDAPAKSLSSALRFPRYPPKPGYPTPFRAFRAPDPRLNQPFQDPTSLPSVSPCAAVSSRRSFVALHPVPPLRRRPVPFRCQPARTQPPRTLAGPIPLVPCLGSAPSAAAPALSGVNRPEPNPLG